MLKKATRQHTKDHNSHLVLQTIYDTGEISRADLARLTRLTRTTVSDVVSGLIDQGLVGEVGQAPAGVGRTPTLLSILDDSRHIVAINITASELQGAIVNLRGGIRHRAKLSHIDGDGAAVLDRLLPFIDGLIGVAHSPLLGIGVSAPGLIDATNGIVRQAVNFGWQDLPLRDLLQARYSLPVYIANDGHTVALAEYMFGRRQNAANLVAIKVGQGIGAGIVLQGQLLVGDEYGAGEIGHVVVEENGLPCKCGNAGCLETVASIPAIVHRAQLLAQHDPGSLLLRFTTSSEITLDTVLQAFQAGDPAVRQIIVTIGRYLGIGVANLIAALGIRHVVITGRIAPFGQVLRDSIRQEVRRRVLPILAQAAEIEIVVQGPDTVLLGTAALLLTNELGLTRLMPLLPDTADLAA
ncbi:MAG: ROK family transcriptional regulator [Kouleothrix sp.]|nr:ROK family transcriptional regulator [Kouleothrix sp.]